MLFYLKENLSLNFSTNIFSKRYGYEATEDSLCELNLPTGAGVKGILTRYEPKVLFNTYFLYEHFFRGLSVGIGVFDILNQRKEFIQPYFGLNVTVPGNSREYYMKISYDFKIKAKSENP